jgi:excisionase family DNA binding protein
MSYLALSQRDDPRLKYIITEVTRQLAPQSLDDRRLTRTIEEAAKLLGVGRSVAYAAARTGALPTVRIGARLVVPVVALAELLTKAAFAQDVSEDAAASFLHATAVALEGKLRSEPDLAEAPETDL